MKLVANKVEGRMGGVWVEEYEVITDTTLRDEFAMAALTGNLAYSMTNPSYGNYHENSSDSDLAKRCYEIADAMIKERANVKN